MGGRIDSPHARVDAGAAAGRHSTARLHVGIRTCLIGCGGSAYAICGVGDAEVDLRYERSDQGTLVAVTRKRGDLLVSVES